MTKRLIESKTGTKVIYHQLDRLADLWNGIERGRELSESRIKENKFVIDDFAPVCKRTYLYEVTEDDVARYFKILKARSAWSTVLSHMSLLSGAFTRFLPPGVPNPFKSIMKRNASKEAATIHHEPLTDTELAKVREKAKVFYGRYAVQLLSIKKIAHEFGCCPNTVSDVLKKIERHVGVKIMRFGAPEYKARHFLPQTRMSRADNKRAVSVYGWHSFRTTFCVHAILHHVPDWMIIKAVGHATFKTTNEYYNNPKRASIKEVWMKALGSTAIGTTQTPLIQNTITIQS